jgi:hypothetical protein
VRARLAPRIPWQQGNNREFASFGAALPIGAASSASHFSVLQAIPCGAGQRIFLAPNREPSAPNREYQGRIGFMMLPAH